MTCIPCHAMPYHTVSCSSSCTVWYGMACITRCALELEQELRLFLFFFYYFSFFWGGLIPRCEFGDPRGPFMIEVMIENSAKEDARRRTGERGG